MKRYVAALLVVLGVVGLVGVLAGGAGYAEGNGDENASRAKCSEATLDGMYLFAFDGSTIEGKDQGPFALQGMTSLTAMATGRASIHLTLTGRLVVNTTTPARIPSRRIAQASSPMVVVCRSICSSTQTAAYTRGSRSNPSLK